MEEWLTLGHVIARMSFGTVSQAATFLLNWEGLVGHRLVNHRLLVDHGWLINVDVVVVLAVIDDGSVVSHSF